jgi:hypothetical protein
MKKRRKGHSVSHKKNSAIPRTSAEFFAMSERAQDRWNRVTQAVSKMRADGTSLPDVAREFALSANTLVKLAAGALRKNNRGQYVVKPTDRLLRVVVLPKEDGGLREVGTTDSTEASIVGKYWAAVQRYLETGDSSALRKLRRKTVKDENGGRIRLIKDIAELERLGSAGVLSFESIYAKAA